MTSCIILAAGLSSRFHSPKALAEYNGGYIINHIINTAIHADIENISIVLGAHYEIIQPKLLKHKNIRIVYNKDYNLGQTSSFQAGVHSAPKKTKAFLLWPVDYPFIKTVTIRAMIETFAQNSPPIVIPTFNQHKGHPALLSHSLKKEILSLNPGLGLNTIVNRHAEKSSFLAIRDEGVISSFNTIEQWHQIKKKFH